MLKIPHGGVPYSETIVDDANVTVKFINTSLLKFLKHLDSLPFCGLFQISLSVRYT